MRNLNLKKKTTKTLFKEYIAGLLLIGTVCIGLISCKHLGTSEQNSKVAENDVIVLRYGDVNPEGHIMLKSAHFFADKVKELTKGHVEIDIYPSGQMGDDSQYYQGLQMGGLDMYRGNSASMSQFGDLEVSVLALPYIFRDRDHFWKVCSSELGRSILRNIQESGSEVIGLCYLDEGARNFFTAKDEVTQMSDMKGLKIRSMYSGVLQDTISAFGAVPVPMVYAELYAALQSGEIDGGENPVSAYLSNKFYKVAPYYIQDNHMYAPSVMLMSELTWNHLSEDDQKAILHAAELTEEYNRNEIEAAEEEAYRRLETAGVTVIRIKDPEKWREAAQPIHEKYGANYLGLIKEIQSVK